MCREAVQPGSPCFVHDLVPRWWLVWAITSGVAAALVGLVYARRVYRRYTHPETSRPGWTTLGSTAVQSADTGRAYPQPPRIYGWPDDWLYRRRVSRDAATGAPAPRTGPAALELTARRHCATGWPR